MNVRREFLQCKTEKGGKTTEPSINNADHTKKNLKAGCQMAAALQGIGIVEQNEQNIEKLQNA
jgi:hypothetical protein